MSLISIIIPCYNVEKYIDRCLESVVNQTIGVENLEIICIDDCSTDNTLIKLKKWEQKYPENIMLITYEKNLKQGGARNIGLQYASSLYIGFVDSDDWIETVMYEKLYLKALETGSDICKCKCIRDDAETIKEIDNGFREDQKYIFENINGFYKYAVDKVGNNGEDGGIWCGLYKRNLIIDNNVVFPENLAYEDNYWSSILHLYVHSLYIVDLALYHYYSNPSSTVTTRNSTRIFDRLIIEPMILEEYINRGAFYLFENELFSAFIQRYWLNSLFMVFTRFDAGTIPKTFDLEIMVETIDLYFHEYIEVMKKMPIDIYTQNTNEYLMNLLLVEKSRKEKTLDLIQKEYLSLIGPL